MTEKGQATIHRFTHAAMGTIFETKICHADAGYAGAAAGETFRLLDQLEQFLSHFIPNSDISRISNLAIGQSAKVSIDTFECLLQCVDMYNLSNGVFDVTIGALYKCWLNGDMSLKSPTAAEVAAAKACVGLYHLSFDEDHFSIGMEGGPVALDLGGFGKGFALDKMAELLAEWEIDSFMLNAGQSSLLFGDAPVGETPDGQAGWPITISDPFQNYAVVQKIYLQNTAIGSSGLVKGRHIIDPRNAMPLENSTATWAFAPSAAVADGLSTTFMILSQEDVDALCRQYPEFKAVFIKKGEEPLVERLVTIGEVKSASET